MVRTVTRLAGPVLGTVLLATLAGGGVAAVVALCSSFASCIPF